jgi:long-chain acyl-CoA synthetase
MHQGTVTNEPQPNRELQMTSIATMFADSAGRYGDRSALVLDDVVISYATLQQRARVVAADLVERGLQPGDRVAIVFPNVPGYAVHFFAILMAGGVVVPMNPLLRAAEIDYSLSDSGAGIIITHTDTLDEVRRGAAACGAVVIGAGSLGEEYDERASTVDAVLVERHDDDTAVILYTSGTTGRPKGAQLTHLNLLDNADLTRQTLIESGPDDVVMGCLPLFHVFGLTCGLIAAMMSGATLTLIPRFDRGKALTVIGRDKVTVFEGVPTMYATMLNHPDREQADLSTLRACICGGAALPVEVMRGFEKAFGCIILEGWGLSETSPVACFNHPALERKPGSIGTPVRGVELKIVDDLTLAELPDDQVGEILVKGPNVMKGYWQNPQATDETIIDGWLRTGDLARRDGDGYYYIVDRKKDLIIRGGYNVYPREVEEVLYEHPDITEAAVVGLPDATIGEEVTAMIALRPGSTETADSIREWIKERVAAYKYPRFVQIVDELPKGPTGKLLKREIDPEQVRASHQAGAS